MPRPLIAAAVAVLLVAGCGLEAEDAAEPTTTTTSLPPTTTVSEAAISAALQEM